LGPASPDLWIGETTGKINNPGKLLANSGLAERHGWKVGEGMGLKKNTTVEIWLAAPR
jgi:hypothetical protein